MKNLCTKSFINAAGTLLYVLLVVLLLSNAETVFKESSETFIPVFMILLFLVSATITGWLVLGKPILLYLDSQKKDAVTLFAYTVGWLVLFLIVVAGLLLV